MSQVLFFTESGHKEIVEMNSIPRVGDTVRLFHEVEKLEVKEVEWVVSASVKNELGADVVILLEG